MQVALVEGIEKPSRPLNPSPSCQPERNIVWAGEDLSQLGLGTSVRQQQAVPLALHFAAAGPFTLQIIRYPSGVLRSPGSRSMDTPVLGAQANSLVRCRGGRPPGKLATSTYSRCRSRPHQWQRRDRPGWAKISNTASANICFLLSFPTWPLPHPPAILSFTCIPFVAFTSPQFHGGFRHPSSSCLRLPPGAVTTWPTWLGPWSRKLTSLRLCSQTRHLCPFLLQYIGLPAPRTSWRGLSFNPLSFLRPLITT